MSILIVPLVFGGILGLYCLVEDVLWAAKPMARPLSRRELNRRYRQRLNSTDRLERESAQYARSQRELLRWSNQLVGQK